jgi:hypothetical protein
MNDSQFSGLSLAFVEQFIYKRNYGDVMHPKTVALGRLMKAVGVPHFFFIQEMATFLERLNAAHRAFGRHFSYPGGPLFEFSHEGQRVPFTLKDLRIHIGFQAIEGELQSTRRFYTRFYRDPRLWSLAADILEYDLQDFKGSEKVNARCEAKGSIEDAIMEIDEEEFFDVQGCIDWLYEDLLFRQEERAGWVFDTDRIPAPVIEELKNRILGIHIEKRVMRSDQWKIVCDAAYLAWLWANDHIDFVRDENGQSVDAFAKDYIDIREGNFMGYREEGGVNLMIPYNEYGLRDFEKELKGLEMKKITRERVVASLGNARRKHLLRHFNNIYECNEFGDREMDMVYLAWLYHHEWAWLVGTDNIGDHVDKVHVEFDEKNYEVPVADVEGCMFEDQRLYHYYKMDELPALLDWKTEPPWDYFWQYHKW